MKRQFDQVRTMSIELRRRSNRKVRAAMKLIYNEVVLIPSKSFAMRARLQDLILPRRNSRNYHHESSDT